MPAGALCFWDGFLPSLMHSCHQPEEEPPRATGRSAIRSVSGFPQQKINHPASPYMFASRPTVAEDVLILAAGFFEGIGENRQTVESTVVVDGLGHSRDRTVVPGQPGGIDGSRSEGVAYNLMDEKTLRTGFFLSGIL
jgi:hypothetical protein